MPDRLSQAISQSWTVPLWPTLSILILAAVYLRGWLQVRATRARDLPSWRALCFIGGLLVLWLCLASPIDALGQFLLSAHMAQHWALMSVAAPLVVLGAPVVPLLRGLPRSFIREDLAPWMNARPVKALQRFVSHPLFGWLTMNTAFLGWHVPAAYELALRSNGWHDVEHGCFFFFSIAFWWFVLRPWPSHNPWSRWIILPYLVLADLVNTGLSAFLAFCGRVVYPTYAAVPRIFDFSALSDQTAAGAGMWVLGSLPFLATAAVITHQLLTSDKKRKRQSADTVAPSFGPSPVSPRFDLIRLPAIGWLLRARLGRAALQTLSLAVLVIIVMHGLGGTPFAAFNLAGAPLWNLLRPMNLALFLLAGNIFCMACPFTLPREIARRLHFSRIPWPAWLKNKWPAALLLILFFWAYEYFSLWDSPRATAWVLIAYVVAVLLIDTVFQRASFCKYVCPIGQFNFVASLMSPLELGVRNQTVCSTCSGHDCINGNERQRGCELELYLPTKVGNFDCTLCMDCVKACPHDNVAITIQAPMREFTRDPIRSSLRRLSTRVDIAVVLLIAVFSSVINAAVMTSTVAASLSAWQQRFPLLNLAWVSLGCSYLACGGLLVVCVCVAWCLHALTGTSQVRVLFCRLALALVPLGLSMWTAHLSFHFVSTVPTLPLVVQHMHSGPPSMPMGPDCPMPMDQMQMPMMGRANEMMLIPGAKGIDLLSLQFYLLDAGLLFSLYAGWRMVRHDAMPVSRTIAALLFWSISAGAFYALCAWVYAQPMEMRGMGM